LLKKTIIILIVIFVAIQFIRIDKTNPVVDEKLTLKAPKEVGSILQKGCYDCHSNETKWPYYSNIAPISFFVGTHVKKGRKALNFSIYNQIKDDIKVQRLKRAIFMVKTERMALPSYVSAHEEAKLSKDEKNILINWFKDELASLGESN